MASIKKVLSGLSKGKTLAAVSKELDVRESTLRAMVDFMLDKGYLEEIHAGSGCMGCFMGRKCSVPASGERRVKMYMLTKEGLQYINET